LILLNLPRLVPLYAIVGINRFETSDLCPLPIAEQWLTVCTLIILIVTDMAEDTEWMKLPTDEKCGHKLWKARLAGYEESLKLFQTLDDEKSPEFSKYLGLVKKFVVDGNAIAQEKGLEATLAYVENAAAAGKAAGEVCAGIIGKCLNQRAKTRDLGMAILMMYIEAEKQEIVQEELMKGLTNKQPKIVAACVVALRDALRDFGTKIISIKPILKQLQALLEDRDKTVRDETKLLVVEIYRWIGPALKPQIANLKPVQINELEAEFDKLPTCKPQQTRFLRSQQDLKVKMLERQAQGSDQTDAAAAVEESSSAETIDPYELMDPVEVLSKLPADFYEKIEAKKWQERKEVLDALQKLVEAPKLEQGDYNDLVRALKKVVAKDANVILVAVAVKCIALLAAGLRKKFTSHAAGCIEVLLDKFREKKTNVVQALKEATDAVYNTTTLEAVSEACIAGLDHKTPSVKAETAAFIARCFAKCTPVTLPKKLLKLFVTALLKTVNDTAGEVREASFDALGTAMKVITEKAIMPFLADVDSIKMAKVTATRRYCI
jgi:cytoskeleton-associated protein 5